MMALASWVVGLVLALVGLGVQAAGPGTGPGTVLNLDAVTVPQLAQVIFGDVLKLNYVLGPSLLERHEAANVHLELKGTPAQEKPRLLGVLHALGVETEETGGVVFLRAKDGEEKPGAEMIYYRPKFRSVDYIVGITGGLFPKGHFSHQRGISAASVGGLGGMASKPAGLDAATIKPGSPGAPGPASSSLDTGTSAQSLIDKDTDAFIFSGSPADVAKLGKLLPQIDIQAGEVFVRAQLYEVTTGAGDGSGFGLAMSLLNGRFGVTLAQPSQTANAATLHLAAGGNSIDAVFGLFAQDNRFKSLSAPALRLRSGASARFSVGADVPVLGGIATNTTGTTQSVTYQPSGVILSLAAAIRETGIDLDVSQTVSSFTATTAGVTGSPTLLKRELQTQVTAKDGDILVLGGMDQTQDTDSNSGPGFLPAFLTSHSRQADKTEVLLVLQVQRI